MLLKFRLYAPLLYLFVFGWVHANTVQPSALDDLSQIKAPPRTVQDVIRAIEASKTDPTDLEHAKAAIAAPVPDTTDVEVLHSFYRRRAEGYQRIGKMDAAIADMRRAALEYRSSNQRARIDTMIDLGIFENRGGNIKNAIQAYEQAKGLITQPVFGYFMTVNRLLIGAYAQAGDFPSAEAALRDGEATMVLLRRSPNYFTSIGSGWESNLEASRSLIFLFQGRWAESDRAGRLSIKKIREAQERYLQEQTRKSDPPEVVRRVMKNYAQYQGTRLLDIAYVLMMQGRLVDAEIVCREALELTIKVFDRTSVDVAMGLNRLAYIVSEQGRSEEAVLLAEEAIKTYLAGGASEDSIPLIRGRKALGSALVSAHKYEEADKVFTAMKAGIDQSTKLGAKPIPSADIDWVMAMIKMGKGEQAHLMTQEMINTAKKLSNVAEGRMLFLQAFDGMAMNASGKGEQAQKTYEQIMPKLLERIRNDAENMTSSSKQQGRMVMILEDNLSLLANQAQAHPQRAPQIAAQAFTLADLARGSTVQRALNASAARANIKDPQLAALARKEQDMQRRIVSLEELLTGLMSAPPEQQLPSVQARMKLDIEQFKQERNGIKSEIERKFPDYAELVNPKPVSLDRVRQLLKDEEVLVSWYFAEKESFVWAITKHGPPLFQRLSIGRSAMAKTVAHLREALDAGVATVDDIPAFDVAESHKLYQALLAPVHNSLQGKKVMLAVPHAELGQLPLSVLVTGAATLSKQDKKNDFAEYRKIPWLMRDFAVTQLPSVTALAALRNLPAPAANRRAFIGFGDPFFSSVQAKQSENQQARAANAMNTRGIPLTLRSAPKTANVSSAELALLPRLPDTQEEIQEIAKALSADPSQDVFLQRAASVSKVMDSDLSNRRVIMFATHGLVPGELDGLTQPALALSSPDVTGETKGDGLLTMEKILTLKLDADWVVLSACNTASGDGAGSEAVSGLGRAFFYAGARSLLVSNWPVDSEASRLLMTDLFRRQQAKPGQHKANYLREAMQEMIQNTSAKDAQGQLKYTYAHPLFWAPFVVVGD